jgi:hypothetical protein
MVVFNYTGRELSGKVVYYGPALSGKTTNLEYIYSQTPANTRGKMVSMKTKAERTLFFDLLPINRGMIGDFKVRFLLYTVPGQVYYNATRKLVLKGADAIVFVADSQRSQLTANIDSLRNLRTNLLEYGTSLDDLPWVISYNKRDMPEALSLEELEHELNPDRVPSFPSVAVSGEGVFEAFEKVSSMLMDRLAAQLRGEERGAAKAASARPRPSVADRAAHRDVELAIRSAAEAPSVVPPPPGVLPPPVYPTSPAGESPSPLPAGVPARAQARPAAVGTQIAPPGPRQSPVVIEKSIVVPLPVAELQGGRRRIQLKIDVTIDPV